MAATLVGVILVHIALDNISKFIKEGLGKDRFMKASCASTGLEISALDTNA